MKDRTIQDFTAIETFDKKCDKISVQEMSKVTPLSYNQLENLKITAYFGFKFPSTQILSSLKLIQGLKNLSDGKNTPPTDVFL